MDDNNPTLKTLLAAIIADPSDHVARLAYADAIDESDPTGSWTMYPELIHHQHDTTYLVMAKGYHLEDAAEFTVGKDAAAKTFPLQDLSAAADGERWERAVRATLRHGFVSVVCCAAEWWVKYGRVAVQRQPIELVVLADRKPSVMGGGPRRCDVFVWERRSNTDADDSVEGYGSDMIPPSIFAYLTPKPTPTSWPYSRRYYREQDAVADLQRAALAWARAEPLPS